MTTATTMKQLENIVARLNKMNGFEAVGYNTVGAYILDSAYGGWKLAKIVNTSGGQIDVSTGGFISKRELWNQIYTALRILELQTEKI